MKGRIILRVFLDNLKRLRDCPGNYQEPNFCYQVNAIGLEVIDFLRQILSTQVAKV